MLSHSSSVLLVALSSLINLALGAGSGNFTSPGPQLGDYSPDLTFPYGQPQTFTWTVNVQTVALVIWQYDSGTSQYLDVNNTQELYFWDGYPSTDLSFGSIFYLEIYDASQLTIATTPIATSEYFYITAPPTTSSSIHSLAATTFVVTSLVTSASSSTSATSYSVALPSTATTNSVFHLPNATSTIADLPNSSPGSSATSSPNDSATTSPTSTSRSSNVLAIGLGAGLGGAFLLALLAALFFFRTYRRRQVWEQAPPARVQDPLAGREPFSTEARHTYYSGISARVPSQELPTEADPHEK